MTAEDPPRDRAWQIAGWFAVAAVFVLFAAASFAPDRRLWGLNHLAFYADHWRFVVLAVTALFLLPPAAAMVSRAAARAGGAYLRGIDGGANTIALSGVISFVLFAYFRSATKLLGDGFFVYTNYREALQNGMNPVRYFSEVTLSERIYPATELLNFTASWTASRFGASPAGGVWILGCAAGALVVVALLIAIRRADWPDEVRLAGLALVLATGASQLYFGYVEHYTIPLALGLLYVLAAARALRDRGAWRTPVVVLVVGVFCHVQFLLLAPSCVWLILRRVAARDNPSRGLRLAWAVGLLTAAGAIAAIALTPLGRYALPVTGSGDGVFSAAHLADVTNIVLLLCPSLPLLAVFGLRVLLSRRRGGASPDRDGWSLAVTMGVPAWLFVLLFRPELGMARDWDLYAFAAIGIGVPGIVLLCAAAARKDGPSRFLPALRAAVVVSAALVISWVGVNASAGRSVARYRSILEYDKTHPGYAYENLANHYQENYQYSLQIDALNKAYELSRNPRLLLKLGRVYSDSDRMDEAETVLREYLRLVPEHDETRIWLIGRLARRSALDEMIDLCLEGIERSPRVPDYHFFLGNAYLAQGRTEEGLEAFEDCSRLDPPPVMVREMKRLAGEARRNRSGSGESDR